MMPRIAGQVSIRSPHHVFEKIHYGSDLRDPRRQTYNEDGEGCGKMDGDMVGAISIAVGGIAVLISAIIGSLTLLSIENRKRKDDRIRQVKARADAHRQLWYALRQIDEDEKREREEQDGAPKKRHVKNVTENEWLQNYFRDNAVLLAAELHDAYQSTLSMSGGLREMFRKKDEGEDPNIQIMLTIAKREMEAYDRRYRDMDGFDPLKL